MCKLFLGIRHDFKDKEFENLVLAQEDGLRTQKDGCGALTISRDGQVEVFRSLYDYDYVFDKVHERFKTSQVIALHTRIGTQGAKDLDNVHFFKNGNYYFAHNGWVNCKESAFGTKSCESDTKSDKPITVQQLFETEKKDGSATETKASQIVIVKNKDVNRDTAWLEAEIEKEHKQDALEDAVLQAEAVFASCEGCKSSYRKVCKRHKKLHQTLQKAYNKIDEEVLGLTTEDVTDYDDLPSPTRDFGYNRGYQSSYFGSSYATQRWSDSYLFLQEMQKPATVESITQDIEKHKFSGLGLLVEEQRKELFLMVHKESFVIPKKGKYSAYFSYKPDRELDTATYDSELGVPYLRGEKTKSIDTKEYPLVGGVFKLEY